MQEKESRRKLEQKQLGRFVSIFLVMAMLLGVLPISAFAANDADALTNISELNEIERTQSGGLSDFYNVPNTDTYAVTLSATASSGTPQISDGAYQIGTAAELTWFATAINDGTAETQNAVLTADIDLNNAEWTPIGNKSNKYSGTFDGQNHSIRNLSITVGTQYLGLFGNVNGGTIQNLSVDGIITISTYSTGTAIYVGSIGGFVKGNIINCSSNVNISLSGINVKNSRAGGICGKFGDTTTEYILVGCSNRGNISLSANPNDAQYGYAKAGGIAGELSNAAKIDSCYNSGTVNVYLDGFGQAQSGGITNVAGTKDTVNVNNCVNTGAVSRSVKTGIGGCTLSGGGLVGGFGGNAAYYPTNCAYLNTAYTVGMSNTSGQAIADATSGISAKTADELKSAAFLASLNAAAPITDYTVTWIADADGYPTIRGIQAAVGIKSFTVAGVAATIDQKAHTITAELPAETDLTNLTPTIVCFAGATSTPASGTAQNFTNPVTYSAGGVSYTVTLTAAKPDFLGEGTQENPYQISSAELLLKLSTEYNKDPAKFSGKYWKQTNDIDMSGVKFTPIGATTAFSGTYDGGNFAIKNLSISSAGINVGLFGIIGNGATIKNVVLDSSCAISASADQCKVGGIAGRMNSSGKNTIENCINRAAVTCSTPGGFNTVFPACAGGIVGEIASSKNNLVFGCKNYGTVKQTTAATYYAGGIAGNQGENSVIAGCENHGTITALSAETWSGLGNGSTAGGIAAASSGYVSGCYNDGAVSAGSYAGGIVGRNQNGAVVESCYNAGTVTGNAAEANCALGGIVGSSQSSVLNKCYNVGTCTAHTESNSTKIGSIAGSCKIPTDLSGNYFLGTELSQGYGEYTTGKTPTTVMMMPVTDDWLKSSNAVTLLNDYAEPYSLYKATWAKGDSYPVLSKVEKIQSHYAELKTFTVAISGVTYTGTISGTDISIVLPAGTTSITPTITISDLATVNPASGTAVSLTPEPVTFTVTAENGKQVIYTLHANVPTEASGLAALEVYTPWDVFFPASGFVQNTKTYTANVNDTKIIQTLIHANTDLCFKVIPATAGATMTAKLNNGDPITLTAVSSMSANGNSGRLRLWDVDNADNRPIRIGENTITITVTPAGGSESDATVYTLTLNVTPTLKSLSFNGNGQELPLDKTFSADAFAYTLDVPDDVTELTISAVAHSFRSMLEADLLDAIADANDLGHFFLLMEHKGYEIHHGNRLGFRLRGQERYMYPERKNTAFTEENIERAIYGNLAQIEAGTKPAVNPRPKPQPYRPHPKYKGFLALYYHYCHLLGRIEKRQYPPRMTPHLRQEVMKAESYRARLKFLQENSIETVDDLADCMQQAESEIVQLTKQRTILNVRKKKRKKLFDALAAEESLAASKALYEEGISGMESEYAQYADAKATLDACGISRQTLIEKKAKIYEQLAQLNQQIRAERKKLKLCKEISESAASMQRDVSAQEKTAHIKRTRANTDTLTGGEFHQRRKQRSRRAGRSHDALRRRGCGQAGRFGGKKCCGNAVGVGAES